ncbi:MBOAT family O-acyltransferase [Bradyrhizobium iriomotense]|uniref:MBOAT family O-acyltransferase n=1 Tax=Bradyrhizobium iriomotense TaxID=441950 RepID=UPI001B8A25C7|nr:MBOAT family O-acyltransferase [Bradyrhizobium iriomotense]MBR1133279.1 MBOAT family protein [Bradyrhizobium iriomotense]
MLFNSDVFLFAFLPVTLAATYISIKLGGNLAGVYCLILASAFFYGWWDIRGIATISLSITTNFACASVLYRRKEHRTRITALWLGIACNLGALAYFKYTNFFLSNLGFATSAIVMPLAISFYSFQQIAFLVDTYRYEIRSLRIKDYVVTVLFFPHLIAGPLIHYNRIMEQFERSFMVSGGTILAGLPIFCIGLSKKVAIADPIAAIVSPLFAKAQVSPLEPVSAWMAALGYTAQLYFDFSGYSDMAVGIGLMFGITLPANFNAPYRSTSIIDFWRRWHMTLSEFLRTYLYIPLGGGRVGPVRRYSNLFIVMLLGGLWHGAGWTYVLWGALHGSYLIINHLWRSISDSAPRVFRLAVSVLSWPLTFIAVVVAWVFFRAPDFSTALNVLQGMAGQLPTSVPGEIAYIFSLKKAEFFGINLTGLGMPFGDFMVGATMLVISYLLIFFARSIRNQASLAPVKTGVPVGILAWISLFAVVGSAPSEFIYFQF